MKRNSITLSFLGVVMLRSPVWLVKLEVIAYGLSFATVFLAASIVAMSYVLAEIATGTPKSGDIGGLSL